VVTHVGGRDSELVLTREGTQATESDRQLLIELLSTLASPDVVNISDLVDLTY
jgi:hypothetical protein